MRKKMEFSKKLLVMEYIVLFALIAAQMIFPAVDFSAAICAWIGLMGVSHGMYYWKAKNENRVKVPIQVVKSLPKNVLDRVDLTQVIIAIIQAD